MRDFARGACRGLVVLWLAVGVGRAELGAVEIVASSDEPLAAEAEYGIERLKAALKTVGETAKTRTILAGTIEKSGRLRELVEAGKLEVDDRPESLAVKRIDGADGQTLVAAGSDEVGLMYALLDIADAIEQADDGAQALDGYRDISQSPKNGMRRMRVLMHHAANEKDWYHSKEYWDWYIGMLAMNRFNGLNLVYSHQTPYMAPMYAWHLKIDEFPEVRPRGVSDEEREHNLEVMRHIAKLCDERGIELTIGIWQHLPWINSYLKSRPDQEVLVEGLNGENVGRYSYLAMKKLLAECPGIARIQLRPNDESGIHLSEQTAFYRDYVIKAIKESPRDVKLDLRTVGVQESTIQAARDADLDVRTSVKYYGEFLGQPHTPREVLTRGYSYDRYFEKPLKNPVYNEVWMLGSHRVLLWGSEDYGRRFGRNASYGLSIGFETDGPIAQKGYQQPSGPAWRFFKRGEDEYFEHEIERYWAFFRSVGRFSYDPQTPREVWLRPFRKRFGVAAEPMARAYESASQVVGLIVSSHVKDVNMYTWPEVSMGGLIPFFNDLRGVDKGLFPSIDDLVKDELAGKWTGRPGPMRLAEKFERIADETRQALADVAERGPAAGFEKEFQATVNDFRILEQLARYYAHRQREGYLMAKFYRTHDASLLEPALADSYAAVDAWKRLVETADRQYYDKMQTGPVENGHWKDSLFLVETNPKIVEEARDLLRTYGIFEMGFDFGRPSMTISRQVFTSFNRLNDYDRIERFTGIDPNCWFDPRRGFGFVENEDLSFQRAPMVLYENLSGAVPTPGSSMPLNLLHADYVHSQRRIGLRLDVPMEPLRFTLVFADQSADPREHGPFDVVAGQQPTGRSVFRRVRVKPGETVVRQFDRNIRSSWHPNIMIWLNPRGDDADAMISALTVHRFAPGIGHAPVDRVSPEEGCKISAAITLPPRPSGEDKKLSAAPGERLDYARLHFQTDAMEAPETVSMATDDGFVYSAEIPAGKLRGRWLEYRIEAADTDGHTGQFPPAGSGDVLRARITTDENPPAIRHTPIERWPVGKPMPIEAEVTDPDGVAVVRAYFRPMNQAYPFESIVLKRQGDKYAGVIPAGALQDRWDLVYYLEAVDESRNGCYFPDWEKTTPFIVVQTEE